MRVLKQLLKDRKLARLCRIGVWIIAALGALQLALQVCGTWPIYQEIQRTTSQPDNGGVDAVAAYFMFSGLAGAVTTLAITVFFCLILYLLAKLLSAFAALPGEGLDVIIEPLEKVEEREAGVR